MILWNFRITGKYTRLILGILAGILILMRSESVIIVVVNTLLNLKKSGYKFSCLYCVLALLVVFPWVYRNWKVLGVCSLSNNAGINFYRGNNPGEIGEWPRGFDKTYYLLKSNP